MAEIKAVVWDFDGVLNRNARDRHFFWTDRFEEDWGHCPRAFQRHVFFDGGEDLACGRISVHDKLQAWCDAVGLQRPVEDLIDYWYGRDFFPDQTLLAMVAELRARGVQQVVGTNSDRHRAHWVEREKGYGAHVGPVFASGHIGACKPYGDFFAHVEAALDLPGRHILLVDDFEENIHGARAHGWNAHFYRWEGYAPLRRRLNLA